MTHWVYGVIRIKKYMYVRVYQLKNGKFFYTIYES